MIRTSSVGSEELPQQNISRLRLAPLPNAEGVRNPDSARDCRGCTNSIVQLHGMSRVGIVHPHDKRGLWVEERFISIHSGQHVVFNLPQLLKLFLTWCHLHGKDSIPVIIEMIPPDLQHITKMAMDPDAVHIPLGGIKIPWKFHQLQTVVLYMETGKITRKYPMPLVHFLL